MFEFYFIPILCKLINLLSENSIAKVVCEPIHHALQCPGPPMDSKSIHPQQFLRRGIYHPSTYPQGAYPSFPCSCSVDFNTLVNSLFSRAYQDSMNHLHVKQR